MMYPTKNSFPEKSRIQIAGMLQEHLANALDLNTQVKQAHWNVKGPDFVSLHKMFDEVAEGVEGSVDQIAERIVQLGGVAEGTLKTAAKRSRLPEYALTLSTGAQHVGAVATALAYFGESIRSAINLSNEVQDQVTSDLLTEVVRNADKYLWLVEAHAQGGVRS
jgi:starvation-inducible DNA-binding protein